MSQISDIAMRGHMNITQLITPKSVKVCIWVLSVLVVCFCCTRNLLALLSNLKVPDMG